METKPRSQSGFALILAILALMLLTFLGLTLSATTSTELQIATNYRWSQQAYYNAEAGIEAAKIVLRNIQPDWERILPAARLGAWAAGGATKCTSLAVCPLAPSVTTPRAPAATRNYEGVECDAFGTGYGLVLDDMYATPLLNGAVAAAAPYENVTSFLGQPIAGAFTIWVRRDVAVVDNGNFQDWSGLVPLVANGNTTLILTSEGVAPELFPSAIAGRGAPRTDPRYAFAPARAVRVLQVKLQYSAPGSPCDSAEGQAGTTASGANFGACSPLGAGSVTDALGAGGGSGGDTGVK